MKRVQFVKPWKEVLSATSYAKYPAGAVLVVADHVAVIAQRDGVLAGEPQDVPEAVDDGADRAAAKKPAKA